MFIWFNKASLTLNPAQQGQPQTVVSQDGEYYFDGPNKRIAVNVTVMNVGSQQSSQVYEIQDYIKVSSALTKMSKLPNGIKSEGQHHKFAPPYVNKK